MSWDSMSALNGNSSHLFSQTKEQLMSPDVYYNIQNDDDLLASQPAKPNVRSFTVPLLGRFQYVKDTAGFISWSIVLFYWIYGNWSTWFVVLLPHYYDGDMSTLMLLMYAGISALCITSFLRVSTMNPGTLANGQQPQEDWTICGKCCRRRPPLAHHCRRCGQCVRKMDHHCPWINNCVGEDNQYAFMLLLAYAYILSLVTLVLDIMHLYYMPHCILCNKESFMMRHESGIIWTAIVMALLMICGSSGLYVTQHISILFDTPSMEWMRLQHTYLTSGPASITWPVQTKSVHGAYRVTFGDGSMLLFPFPCRRRRFSTISYHV